MLCDSDIRYLDWDCLMVRQDKLTTHAVGQGGLSDDNRLLFNKVHLEATSKHTQMHNSKRSAHYTLQHVPIG